MASLKTIGLGKGIRSPEWLEFKELEISCSRWTGEVDRSKIDVYMLHMHLNDRANNVNIYIYSIYIFIRTSIFFHKFVPWRLSVVFKIQLFETLPAKLGITMFYSVHNNHT